MELSELDVLRMGTCLAHCELNLLVLIQESQVLRFGLLKLSLTHLKFTVNPGNFTLFLIQDVLELVFKLLLSLFEIIFGVKHQFISFFVELFYSFVENFNMELQLLLNFNVVAHLCLVLLKLLLILLRWQFN